MPAVVGIDLAAGRGVTEVAVLMVEDGSRPVFDATSHQRVVTDAEIVAAVSAAQPVVLAIDAPLTLPRAVMRGLAAVGTPPAASSGADATVGALPAAPAAPAKSRVPLASRRLVPSDASAPDSPYTRAAERDPIWVTLGIRPLPVSFLGGLTFRAITLLPRLRAAAPSTAIIEVFPSATLQLQRLAITQSAVGGKMKAAKTTETLRKLVQRGLRQHIEGIALPEHELYGADLLDALAAALTGVAYLRHEYVLIGDGEEGAIVLPAHPC